MSAAASTTFAKSEGASLQWDGRAYAVLAAGFTSLKAIFVKLAYAAAPVDPVTLLALRMAPVLPAFVWMAWKRKLEAPLTALQWFGLLAIGMAGYYMASLFDFIGLQFITAGLERLVLYSYPPMVMLIEALRRHRPVGRRGWTGMALIYLGLVAAFGHDLSQGGDMRAVLIGGAWVLASSLSFAFYCVGSGMLLSSVGPRRLVGVAGTVASLAILAHFATTQPIGSITALPASVWLWAILMAGISTLLPIWLGAKATEKIGAGPYSAIGSLGPALTIAFGWIILGESFSTMQLLGLVLVVGGVWRVTAPQV